jgi:hypothetical protein
MATMYEKYAVKVNFSIKWTKLGSLEALYHNTSSHVNLHGFFYRWVHEPTFYFGAELSELYQFVELQTTNTISCH